MSRLSDWYFSARKRIEKQDEIHRSLRMQRDAQKKQLQRMRETGKKVHAQMRELRRPSDTPPWEKE